MIMLGEALTTTIQNTAISTVNQGSTPSYSSLIRFNLKLPHTSTAYTTLRTEQVSITGLTVNSYAASISPAGTSFGRVLEFFKVDSTDAAAVYSLPTSDQITISGGGFTSIVAQGDGSVGYFDVDTMTAAVSTTTFTSIS
jgi:hypothetical protein